MDSRETDSGEDLQVELKNILIWCFWYNGYLKNTVKYVIMQGLVKVNV